MRARFRAPPVLHHRPSLLSRSGAASPIPVGAALASSALVLAASVLPATACAQTQGWSTVTTTRQTLTGQSTSTVTAAAGRQGGGQGVRTVVHDRPGVQVYGTVGAAGRRETTTTAQVWSTTPGTTIQSGTVYYGPDGQVIGVSPGLSPGPVYVPVPVPVRPYPPAPPRGYPGYPNGWQSGYPNGSPNGSPNGWASPPGRSDGHPYGPDVVPGWGGQSAPDYRHSPQALPPANSPGYYYRPR